MADNAYTREFKDKLLQFVKDNVKQTRYEHTLRVIAKAKEYAERYGADWDRLEVAAIFHDAYRHMGNLEHGPLAAEHLEKDWGVTDPEILEAVRYHTIGRAGACKLTMVLKLADTLEDGRPFSEASVLRKALTDDLEASMLLVMERIKAYVTRSNDDRFNETSQGFIDWLKERVPKDKEIRMSNKETALQIAKALDAKKAQDIVLIDIAERSGFADWFVIADAANPRLLEALADEAEDKMAQLGEELHHKEGVGESGWILLDFGDIIVNLFIKAKRDYYNIEKIWADCDSEQYEPERN
ncbi:MAG: ribosome silencing factor [Firmicutes bacterium]|nr:ribosome silencing factor [Bacillota bacterium]